MHQAPSVSSAQPQVPAELSYATYRQLLFQIAHSGRRLRDIAAKTGSPEQQPLEELLRLVESSHFAVAVVGEFKRGKSTFINALLGNEVLPADIEPCSATLNRVTYGLKPSAQVIFRAEQPGAEERVVNVPIERLSDYVTKLTPDSATMSALVKEAVIAYPVQFCKNNIDIIDTPGLNDDAVMTAVTHDVLAKVHAAIMVVMANAPFGESESAFLREVLLKDHSSVLFVVTAIDRIRRQADRDRVLNAVRTRVREAVERFAEERFGTGTPEHASYLARMGEPMVFGLSGYQALEARRERNDALFQESGFGTFEAALEQFLTRERGPRALADVIERMILSGSKVSAAVSQIIDDKQAKIREETAVERALWAKYVELRSRCDANLARIIDNALFQLTYATATAGLDTLATELKIAAGRVVEQAEITPELLSAALKEMLGDVVGNTGQNLFDKLPPGQVQNTGKRAIGQLAGWISGRPGGARQESTVNVPAEPIDGVVAKNRIIQALPAEIYVAIDKVFKSFIGACHKEIQRNLQEVLDSTVYSLADFDEGMVVTRKAFPSRVDDGTAVEQFKILLVTGSGSGGLWAAENEGSVRIGPSLTQLKAEIEKTLAVIQIRVGVMMLSSPTTDQFKAQLIRANAEQITQIISRQQDVLRQAVAQDIAAALQSLLEAVKTVMTTHVGRYEVLLRDIGRLRERAEIINTLSIDEHMKLQAEIGQISTDSRALANSLRAM